MTKIAVIGLGYVGLPLAVALAPHYSVVGFDVSPRRVDELIAGKDRTNEVESAKLQAAKLTVSSDPACLKEQDVYIVTVPTPVDRDNQPDLGAVLSVCETLGQYIRKGAVIVFESTVYPGVTEKICGPAIECASDGLKMGVDFQLAYSPERVNPGDKQHTVETVTKIVSASTPETAQRLAEIYGKLNGGNIHIAPSIMAAEAAKVVENAQRDINIAFVNEVSAILRRLGVPTQDVLDAMATKWNALPFKPGLVGGHCIGVDPFYLAACGQNEGYDPNLILQARRVNDEMAQALSDELHALVLPRLKTGKIARILVLGLTFKEDVPDLRNSKVADLIAALSRHGHIVTVMDAMADPDEAYAEYDVALSAHGLNERHYDMVIGAVAHEAYRTMPMETLVKAVAGQGIVADIKGMWRQMSWPEGVTYWQI